MSNEILIKRINELCEERGISRRQMERDAGIASGSTSKWVAGSMPNQKTLQKLGDYFNVSVGWLIGESPYRLQGTFFTDINQEYFDMWNEMYDSGSLSEYTHRIEKGVRIPVLGKVIAGIPIDMVEDVIGWEELSIAEASKGEFFGLQITGDSMSPRMLSGDVVIVRKQNDAESGDIVIAAVNGDTATCKKLMKYESGISLISLNPAYNPMYFTNAEIVDKPVKIIGKVVELRGKL